MHKRIFDVSDETINLLKTASLIAEKEDVHFQKEKIEKASPYSQDINNAFSGYEEFEFLHSLGLKEALVTRKALIRNIDFDLFITCKQKTNYELMLDGSSPYLTDNEDDCIVIHHIGQTFNAPFAELTIAEHSQFGNSKMLHDTRVESWRNDPAKKNQFQAEKFAYWKQRANQRITYISKEDYKVNNTHNHYKQKSIIIKIKEPLEKIFSACSIEDLKYISNLANGYILTKQAGGKTIEEFILNSSKELKRSVKCPKCNSKQFIYYGYQETNHERKQRYKCKDCGSVFSLFNNTIISGCNLSFMQWIQFIDCLYNGYSLNKTAKLCNISVQTAFDNRLRLFYALKVLEQKVVLKGNIVIDETYMLSSHKGNRSEKPKFDLIRPARKRGKENHTPGTSKEQVCIVCALDSYNNSVAKIAGLGAPTAQKIDAVLKDCFDKSNIISLYSDKSSAIKKFAEINSYPIVQTSLSKKRKSASNPLVTRYVQKINSYHSRLKKFISSYNGLSSELIEGYMCLFSWRDRNRGAEPIEAYKELLSIMVSPNLYKTIDQIGAERIIERVEDIENRLIKPRLTKETEIRYREIYSLWGEGKSMQEIANQYSISRQRVHQIIKKYMSYGYAWTTKRDKNIENRRCAMQKWQSELENRHKKQFERNMTLLKESLSWKGSSKDFYFETSNKYNIKEQTVRNRICDAKRTLALTKQFKISDKFEYSTLEDVFNLIYNRYCELKRSKTTKGEGIYNTLASEFGYKRSAIAHIISCMNGTKKVSFKAKNSKIPVSQALNRDISVFIDYMKWTGDRKSFFEFVEKRYGISRSTTYKILEMNYMADPKRFEITKMY